MKITYLQEIDIEKFCAILSSNISPPLRYRFRRGGQKE